MPSSKTSVASVDQIEPPMSAEWATLPVKVNLPLWKIGMMIDISGKCPDTIHGSLVIPTSPEPTYHEDTLQEAVNTVDRTPANEEYPRCFRQGIPICVRKHTSIIVGFFTIGEKEERRRRRRPSTTVLTFSIKSPWQIKCFSRLITLLFRLIGIFQNKQYIRFFILLLVFCWYTCD